MKIVSSICKPKICSMKRLCVFLALVAFVGVNFLQAQTVQITGAVTSAEDGMPIPGVSVMVKGTTIGTSTDADGKYSLAVPQTATTLVYSFVGLRTLEAVIAGRTVIDVVLTFDALALEEIVVTALGIRREKKALGYSVQEVGGDEISRSSNPNLMTALSGKVAGLEVRQSSGMPGAPSTIFIRGARSFSGNNQPLYVVDGMPIASGTDYDQNVTGAYHGSRVIDIDPNDIESVNVLKGQAAAALYGLRASNGVIIITTKSGSQAKQGKPMVTINTSYSQDMVARLPEIQQLYAQGAGGNFAPVNSMSWGPLIENLPDNATYGGNSQGHPGLFFHPQKNEWVEPKAYNAPKDFFETGGSFNNHIGVSQIGAIGNYSLGIGSTHQTGIVMNTGMQRYTGKMSGTMNLSDIFKVGFTGNISDVSMQKLPSGNDSWLFTVFGAPPSYDLMGTPYHVPSGPYNTYRQISYRQGAVGENPIWAVKNNRHHEATKRFFGNSFIEANPAEWVNLRYQLGIDMYSTDQEILYQMGSAGAGQGLPGTTAYPSPTNPEYAYIAPAGGRIQNFGVIRRNVNSLFNATFTHQFTDDLRGSLIIGNEIVNNTSRSWTMTGNGFSMPGYNNMANTTTQTAGESKGQSRTVGFYGNLALEYMSMVFLNATGRQDYVSTMPRGSRSFFYPSVSLGFVFTELGALKGNNMLPFGKVRVSYAEVGQAGTYYDVAYSLGSAYWSGYITNLEFPLGGISGYRPSRTLYDPNLVPQNTKTMEFGLELRFLDNRIGVDYAFTNQDASKQIFAVPLAGSTGYTSLVMNAGEMKTVSHEIILYLTPVKTGDFEWNLNANFTKYTSEVVELAEGVETISLGGYVTPNIRASAGDPYPSIYGNTYQRDDEGRILINENESSPGYGMPLMGEFGKIGDVTPDFYMGFTNTFTYKFITLSAQIDWKKGGQMYSGSNRLMDLYGVSKATEDRVTPFIIDGYKADGTPNDIERGGPEDPGAYEYLYASVYSPFDEKQIYETSFVKLRDVSLSIALPNNVIKPLGLQNASINFHARNFLLWTTLPNFDPETAQGMGNMVGGMDYMSLPQTKSFGVGLNLTF